MPKLDLLSAAVWKIYGGGGPNVNSLVVRGFNLIAERRGPHAFESNVTKATRDGGVTFPIYEYGQLF